MSGDPNASLVQIDAALALAETALKSADLSPTEQANIAAAIETGAAIRANADPAAAQKLYAQAIKVREKLAQGSPAGVSQRVEEFAVSLYNLAEFERNLDHYQEALALFQRADRAWRTLKPAFAQQHGLRKNLADCLLGKAKTLRWLGGPEHLREAVTALEEGSRELQELLKVSPEQPAVLNGLGLTQYYLACAFGDLAELAKSFEAYGDCLKTWNRLAGNGDKQHQETILQILDRCLVAAEQADPVSWNPQAIAKEVLQVISTLRRPGVVSGADEALLLRLQARASKLAG